MEQAHRVYSTFHEIKNVKGRIEEIEEAYKAIQGVESKSWVWAILQKEYRFGILVSCCLSVAEEVCGSSIINNRAQSMIREACGYEYATLLTSLVFFTSFLTVLLTFPFIDLYGRKTLLLIGASGNVMLFLS